MEMYSEVLKMQKYILPWLKNCKYIFDETIQRTPSKYSFYIYRFDTTNKKKTLCSRRKVLDSSCLNHLVCPTSVTDKDDDIIYRLKEEGWSFLHYNNLHSSMDA